MKHEVILQRIALEDLAEASTWIARHSPSAALLWLKRIREAMETLAHNPERCPIARESRRTSLEIRQLLFGRRPHVFRILFVMEHEQVRILRVRRAQRRWLTKEEIDEAGSS